MINTNNGIYKFNGMTSDTPDNNTYPQNMDTATNEPKKMGTIREDPDDGEN